MSENAEIEALELDPKDLSEMEIGTLAGDLRDLMLTQFKQRQRPWTMLTEEEQYDMANSMELAAKDMIRRTVQLITAWEFPRAVVTMGEVKIIPGDKARLEGKVTAPNITEYRDIMGEMAGERLLLIAVDSQNYMGQKDEPEIDPDEPSLPMGDDEGDQKDAA